MTKKKIINDRIARVYFVQRYIEKRFVITCEIGQILRLSSYHYIILVDFLKIICDIYVGNCSRNAFNKETQKRQMDIRLRGYS